MEFSDDFFDESHSEKTTKRKEDSKDLQILTEQWFIDIDNNKFRADHAFYQAQYQEATAEYNQILKNLPATNTTVKRDVLEALIHCYLALNQLNEAKTCSDELLHLATTVDQFSSSLLLISEVHKALQNYALEMRTLWTFLNIHSMYIQGWIRLALCYANMANVELLHVMDNNNPQKKFKVSNDDTKYSDPKIKDTRLISMCLNYSLNLLENECMVESFISERNVSLKQKIKKEMDRLDDKVKLKSSLEFSKIDFKELILLTEEEALILEKNFFDLLQK